MFFVHVCFAVEEYYKAPLCDVTRTKKSKFSSYANELYYIQLGL